MREGEAVFRRLAGNPHTLSFYVDIALTNYREPEKGKSLIDAVSEYVAARQREMEQGQVSRPQFNRIRWDLKRLQDHFPDKTLGEITASVLVTFLEMGHPGMKTYNNRRGILSTLFRFAFERGWIAENPIIRLAHHRIRHHRGAAQAFSAAQASALMEEMERFEGGRWVPFFALCLFAGIRPGVPEGEISKLRPEDVNLVNGVINISAETSKVREPRKVAIQPNLAAWLRAYPLDKYPIVVANFQKRRARFAKRFNLTHDVLRATFISMFVAKFRALGEAALQAGNSESIIRNHYLDLKTAAEAEEFFSIFPKDAKPTKAAGSVIPSVSGLPGAV